MNTKLQAGSAGPRNELAAARQLFVTAATRFLEASQFGPSGRRRLRRDKENAARTFVTTVCCVATVALLAACQQASPAAAPSRTTSPPSVRPSVSASATSASATSAASSRPAESFLSSRAIADALCAAVFHGSNGGLPGGHCEATNVKESGVDRNWVYGHEGLYTAQGTLASDNDEVMLNLKTHQLIGPTNVGLCGAGPGHDQPVGVYGSVPADVLASLGLHQCGSIATTSAAPTSVTTSSSGVITTFKAFAGAWGAHETSLTITPSGRGHMTYADLTACPSCPEAEAPRGTLDFELRTSAGGAGMGAVTSSSDAKVWAVNDSVIVKLSAGSPGQLLNVAIAGKQLVAFCNGTSAGQCGA